jgi:NADH-quinone oxidoreductase subunit E
MQRYEKQQANGADALVWLTIPPPNQKSGEFSLETVAFLGCCSLAPVVMVNEDVYGGLSSSKVRSTLKKYGKE